MPNTKVNSVKPDAPQKTGARVVWEITNHLRSLGISTHHAFPLIPYLFYKASLQGNLHDIPFQAITNNVIELNEDIRLLAKEVLTDESWQQLVHSTSAYTPAELSSAVLAVVPFDRRSEETFTTPDSILRLVHRLLNVKEEEKIADICCGSGSYLLSAAQKEPNASYHGYELNAANKAAAMMKADVLGVDIDITLCDVFAAANTDQTPLYDKIFANYPFGLRWRYTKSGRSYLERLMTQYPGLPQSTSSDWVFNALIVNMLTKDGKAAAIMTNGSTWNKNDIFMRKYFAENQLIECVISLPGKLFAEFSMPTTLIIFSHHNDTIRMIDASTLCQQGRRQNDFSADDIETIIEALTHDHKYSRCISLKELRENEYTLNLNRYSAAELKFSNGVPFESIIKSISRGVHYTASQLDNIVSNTATDKQYLTISHIQNSIIDQNLPYLTEIDPKYEKYCLKKNMLIISKNGYPYKIAVASVKEGQHILATGNLYLIELDENKANPYYINAFFDSNQGAAVLKSITVGTILFNLGVDNLKKVVIPLPPMEEQNRIAQQYQATLDEIVATKLRLEKAIDKRHHIWNKECE